MHPRESPRSSGQRRPRLLRASVTEPSIFTSSIVKHGAVDMSQPTSSGGGSPSTSNSYRRATDLLNHVAYLSSCAASPVSSLTSSPLLDRMVPRRSSQSTDSSASAAISSTRRSHSISHAGSSDNRATDASGSRRRESDEVFGSSPASTHTSGSLEDLHAHHQCLANYYSFPSFDTWDPDSQDKEDDVDG